MSITRELLKRSRYAGIVNSIWDSVHGYYTPAPFQDLDCYLLLVQNPCFHFAIFLYQTDTIINILRLFTLALRHDEFIYRLGHSLMQKYVHLSSLVDLKAVVNRL